VDREVVPIITMLREEQGILVASPLLRDMLAVITSQEAVVQEAVVQAVQHPVIQQGSEPLHP
jgi:hypothetical protein